MKPVLLTVLFLIPIACPLLQAQEAGEIIDKCLAAAGGEEKLRAIDSLIIKGSQGIIVLNPPPEGVTAYLKQPGLLKMVGDYQTTIFNGKEAFTDNGDEKQPITGEAFDDIKTKVSLAMNGYSLLNWEAFLDSAVFEGKKKYGPHEEYIIQLPEAMNGQDLFVHIDAGTFLIDRLVYSVPHEKAKILKLVTRFRDWRDVDGLMLPFHILYDKVGWGGEGSHFMAQSMEINTEIETGFLDTSEIDFGRLVCSEGKIEGEARGDYFGYLQSNIRDADLEKIGVKDGDHIRITIGEHSVEAIYVADVMASKEELKPEDTHFFRYPRSGYPRLMMICQTKQAEELIAFKKGDKVLVTKIENEQ